MAKGTFQRDLETFEKISNFGISGFVRRAEEIKLKKWLIPPFVVFGLFFAKVFGTMLFFYHRPFISAVFLGVNFVLFYYPLIETFPEMRERIVILGYIAALFLFNIYVIVLRMRGKDAAEEIDKNIRKNWRIWEGFYGAWMVGVMIVLLLDLVAILRAFGL